jgi:predicted phosphodiesterase
MNTTRDLRSLFVTFNPDHARAGGTSRIQISTAQLKKLGPRPELGGRDLSEIEISDAEMAALYVEFGRALAELQQAGGLSPIASVLYTPDHAMAAALQGFFSLAAPPEMLRDLPNGRGQEVPLDDHDYAGWIRSFFTWYKGIRKHAFPPLSAEIDTLPDSARVAVLGDWGSGLYGAPKIADLIDQDPHGYDLAIHLGDVYYSGLREEVEQRFLKLWPKRARKSRALNSNHEMYTGGYGYFDLTLPAFNQKSSTFAIANAHFLLVGLDTAYDEHDLTHDQAVWLDELVQKAGSRKLILFSHHQPFSLFEKQGPKLVQKLGRLLTQKRVHAWFWGHVHRCTVYDLHPQWQLRGRLIGHSGYPYFREGLGNSPITLTAGTESTWRRLPGTAESPSGLVLDGPNPFIPESPERYGPNGWVTLELDGPNATEVYYNAEGEVLLRQSLT